jgi:hypothetical protein
MHSYSIDNEERTYVILILGVISIFVIRIFYSLIDLYKIDVLWWIESPTVLSCFGFLYLLFDRFGWKYLSRWGVIKTPILTGDWDGILQTSFDKHANKKKCKLNVFQTWTKIKLILETSESKSRSESASLVLSAPDGYYLSYQYMNEPKPEAVVTMKTHRGVARLFIGQAKRELVGEYFTGRDRGNFGSLVFHRMKTKRK